MKTDRETGDTSFPPATPKRHETLGQLCARCWDREDNHSKLMIVCATLAIVALAMILGGVLLWDVPGIILGALGVLGLLAAIAISMERLLKPLTLKAAYENGLAVVSKNGPCKTYPWDHLANFHIQECYNFRNSPMHLIYRAKTRTGETIEFRSNDAGSPEVAAEAVSKNCPTTYESWEEVLQRSG